MSTNRNLGRAAFVLLALLFGTVTRAQAQNVTLAWDRNPESNIAGYTVYVGVNPGSYSQTFDVSGAATTSFTFTQALPGQRYYFSVAAYNNENVAGPRSGEISWKINVAPTLAQPANQSSSTGTAVSLQLSATDDGDPLTYTASNLPSGVSINASTGRISGTPTTAQTRTVTVNVTDGQYTASRAFTWTVVAPLSVTALATDRTSPQPTGTGITLTPSVTGGVAPLSYKYYVFNGSTWTIIRDWSTTATATWTPTQPNANYNIAVWVRNAGNTADSPNATLNRTFTITSVSTPPPATPLVVSGLATSLPSPQQTGTAITLTPSASGGTSPYSYKYFVFNGTSWSLLRDWSTTATVTWTPTQASANYNIAVWARSAGTTADSPQATFNRLFTITSPSTPPTSPLALTGLNSSVASPQPTGTAITFTPVLSGGTTPHSFKYYVFNGTSWGLLRDWSTTASVTWTPTQPNAAYNIAVWVRNASSTADAPEATFNKLFTITSATPSVPLAMTGVTASVSSPQVTGTSINLTAAATGGTAPYSYKFYAFNGTSWSLLRDWGTSATLTWTPTQPALYNIAVWARSAGNSVDGPEGTFNVLYSITGAGTGPLVVTGLNSSVSGSATVGTAITLTPVVSGGTAPVSYKYYVFNGATWTLLRDWSTTASVTWTPTQAYSAYNVALWVRSAGSMADAPTATFNRIFTITP